MDDASEENIRRLAKIITDEFPRSSLKELSITDIGLMIKNTYLYALNYAYKGIIEGQRPTPLYINDGWYYCRKLIAMAGYRTANILKKLLPKINF